jgi:hypothetical protein
MPNSCRGVWHYFLLDFFVELKKSFLKARVGAGITV